MFELFNWLGFNKWIEVWRIIAIMLPLVLFAIFCAYQLGKESNEP